MYSKWTSHLASAEDKEKFQNHIKGSRDVLDRLIEILDEKEKEYTNMELSISIYDQSNWAERQAHMNGYRSCSQSIRKLIDLDQQITT